MCRIGLVCSDLSGKMGNVINCMQSSEKKPESEAREDATDVDISLIELNLRLSHEQRIQKHHNALQFVQELKMAGRVLGHAKPWQSA